MRKSLLAATAATLLLLTGCSQVSTAPDMVALHYEGGSFSSKKFKECVPASTRQLDGPGDKHYRYPTRQVSFDATGGKGAESDPFTSVSADNAELRIPVTVVFTLKTDCDTLRRFHETLGLKYAAFWEDDESSKSPGGWIRLLNFAIGKPLDTTLDREAQKHNWRDLWNDPSTKTAVEQAVATALEPLVKRQTGVSDPGEEGFFEDFSVLIQKPDPINEGLKEAIALEQTAIAKQQAAEREAAAAEETAIAQTRVAKEEAKQKQAEIEGFGGLEGYLRAQRLENEAALIAADQNPYQPGMVLGGFVPQQQN